MKQKKVIVSLLSLMICLAIQCFPKDQKLNRWIEKGDFKKAEKYCLAQKGQQQQECFKILADAYYYQGNYEKAAQCYDKAGEEAKNEGYKRIADAYADKADFETSLDYLKKIPNCAEQALVYGKLGDFYKKKGSPDQAKYFYQKAVDQYELLLKSFLYTWEPSYYNDRQRFLDALNSFEKPIEELLQLKKLSDVLQRAADYCTKLKRSSIYFFCHEEISETINHTMDLGEGSRFFIGEQEQLANLKRKGIVRETYLYEYQLVQEEYKLEETRKLLRKNNLPARLNNAPLETKSFKFKEIIFGPVGLLSTYWQEQNHYKILKEEVLAGEKVIVIQCLPRSHRDSNPHFGKVWIKPDDGSVVKIEWNPKTLGITEFVRKIAKKAKSTPVFKFFTEYGIEKNGIRFPSRSFLEEAYINKEGKKSIMVELIVYYKNYKYFSVGTEVLDVK